MIKLYFIGSAGSGKSSLTMAFMGWMQRQGFDAITVNLDPGIENSPYVPDIDIREWIKIHDIMKEHGVGPNGAQIIAADMLAMNLDEMEERIDSFETEYIIFDTPGQMELFVLRQSGKYLIEALGAEESMIGFLFDPIISRTPSGFISLLLQAASIEVRFNVPFISILTKSDLLDHDSIERILNWSKDILDLEESIHDEKPMMRNELSIEFLSAIKSLDSGQKLIPVSSTYGFGMEDIYNAAQEVFYGGEDLSRN